MSTYIISPTSPLSPELTIFLGDSLGMLLGAHCEHVDSGHLTAVLDGWCLGVGDSLSFFDDDLQDEFCALLESLHDKNESIFFFAARFIAGLKSDGWVVIDDHFRPPSLEN